MLVEKLKSLLDGSGVVEHNGIVFVNDGNEITVTATGSFTSSVVSFKLNSVQLRLLRMSLESTNKSILVFPIFKHKNGIRLVFDWTSDNPFALDLVEDGTSVVHEYWGAMVWDRWTVFPDGKVQYTGDSNVGGDRPKWVEAALAGG